MAGPAGGRGRRTFAHPGTGMAVLKFRSSPAYQRCCRLDLMRVKTPGGVAFIHAAVAAFAGAPAPPSACLAAGVCVAVSAGGQRLAASTR